MFGYFLMIFQKIRLTIPCICLNSICYSAQQVLLAQEHYIFKILKYVNLLNYMVIYIF
jgi:hypothetical protein